MEIQRESMAADCRGAEEEEEEEEEDEEEDEEEEEEEEEQEEPPPPNAEFSSFLFLLFASAAIVPILDPSCWCNASVPSTPVFLVVILGTFCSLFSRRFSFLKLVIAVFVISLYSSFVNTML